MPDNKKHTVLIIDDDPLEFEELQEHLEKLAFEVLTAHNGADAFSLLEQTKPDIILLDVLMPGLNGFEICYRLKADKATKDIPVIFMTGLTEAMDEVTGLKLGAVDYVFKPVHIERVTARINTHLTLRKLQLDLQKQNQELDAFARTVAHDLKTPIGVIVSYVHYFDKIFYNLTKEEQLEFFYAIKDAGQKAINIIHELLLLASVRIENVDMHPLDMESIVFEAKQRLILMVEMHNGEFILPDKWPVAKGYGPWIEEVWTNYISNALKYGGKPPRMELGATPQGDGTIRFWIKDNGQGIAPKVQKNLFTEFTRLEQVRTKGHGLGLSIVRRIMDKLGGTVGVKSDVGQGSEFYFVLPAYLEKMD